jgi:hypothetical protein
MHHPFGGILFSFYSSKGLRVIRKLSLLIPQLLPPLSVPGAENKNMLDCLA